MEESKVFMVHTKEMDSGHSLIDRLDFLIRYEEIGLDSWINKGDIVAIKTHFGSRNQTRHLRPMYIRKIVDFVRAVGGIPWICECVGVYWDVENPENTMANGPGYVSLANRHGFNIGTMNAPIVMLDGTLGTDTFKVDVSKTGKYEKAVPVAMGFKAVDKVLIVSHFKGHDGAGFGGALKQLGVGCVGVEAKGSIHWGEPDNIYVKNLDNCNGCGKCLKLCPTNCLSLDTNNKIVHDASRCITCMHCFAICHSGKKREETVFAIRRRVPSTEQVERMMDNAGGVVKAICEENLRYINIAIDITSHCDCVDAGGHPLVPDQGILYSTDPVAIDQASVDLVTKAKGLSQSPAETGLASPYGNIEPVPDAMEENKEKLGLFGRFTDPETRPIIAEIQLKGAVAQNLGSRDYKLIDITPKKENNNA